MVKSVRSSIVVLTLLMLLYFLFYPVTFDPVSFSPPHDPGLTGPFKKNEALKNASQLLKGIGTGPESIAVGLNGELYTGYENGDIYRFDQDGNNAELFRNTGGHPLGMKIDKEGNLIVADEQLGLLKITPHKQQTVLTKEAGGKALFFTDDLDIAENGTIYFTDASQRNKEVINEAWELQATGRLISFNPKNGETKVELDNLRFANGVALGPNDDYLLVSETFGMVINKLWLTGPKKGQKEVLVNELPGYPDNITYNEDGIFWIALPSLRLGEFEALFDKPFLRKVIARLPKAIAQPEPIPYGMLIGINEAGEVVKNYQDPSGNTHTITSAVQIDKHLFLGSLEMNSVTKFRLD